MLTYTWHLPGYLEEILQEHEVDLYLRARKMAGAVLE